MGFSCAQQMANNSTAVLSIAESVDKFNKLVRPHNTNSQAEMVEQYGRVKCILPAPLRGLCFRAAPDVFSGTVNSAT